MSAADFSERLEVRNAALDFLAASVPQPDLTEWETTIPGSAGRYGLHEPHTHGSWVPGHTAGGSVVWFCGGCFWRPPVRVPLPELGRRILAEWWDGYRVETARQVKEPLDSRP